MKILVHRTAVSSALPFALDDLKSHICKNDDGDEAATTNIGYKAAAEIMKFIQIALLPQTIRFTIFDPVGD